LGDFEVLGGTIDDAAGEALIKQQKCSDFLILGAGN
jgi:tRNA A37 threonylcarbamoyltransferase TsaD